MDIHLGFDVGTSSVRVVGTSAGKALSSCSKPLSIHNPRADYFEQSTNQIWRAVCSVTKQFLHENRVNPNRVKAIAFDATCSLVVLNQSGEPFSVTPEAETKGLSEVYDVIMWMDHRAIKEAAFINSTNHNALQSVGGRISPEMQPPKLLWLKNNLSSAQYREIGYAMDLTDFLSYKCTGVDIRSSCTVSCKWLYQYTKPKGDVEPDLSFWKCIGLDDSLSLISAQVLKPGSTAGMLTELAANDIGLDPEIPVKVGLIDAHAGALALLHCRSIPAVLPENILTMIAGTSVCYLTFSGSERRQIDGVWGPYRDVVVPGHWSHEPGQGFVAPILDRLHEQFPAVKSAEHLRDELLPDQLSKLGPTGLSLLANNVHVWPDFYGNRSPFNNPDMKGAILGLPIDSPIVAYVAHIQAFALMTKLIVDTLTEKGYVFSVVHLCGGLQKNSLFVQTHADVLGMPVFVPKTEECVALGASILAGLADGFTVDSMKTFQIETDRFEPNVALKKYFEKKCHIFCKLGQLQADVYKN